jgi:hypothetical protein
VNTNQREQYGGTVHLVIDTGHSLCEITFMSFTTSYNHDTNYHGSIGLFIFKSVHPFVSRRVVMPKLPGWYLRLCFCVDLSKVFLLTGPLATKQTPSDKKIYYYFFRNNHKRNTSDHHSKTKPGAFRVVVSAHCFFALPVSFCSSLSSFCASLCTSCARFPFVSRSVVVE